MLALACEGKLLLFELCAHSHTIEFEWVMCGRRIITLGWRWKVESKNKKFSPMLVCPLMMLRLLLLPHLLSCSVPWERHTVFVGNYAATRRLPTLPHISIVTTAITIVWERERERALIANNYRDAALRYHYDFHTHHAPCSLTLLVFFLLGFSVVDLVASRKQQLVVVCGLPLALH